ncbi:MAG: NAD(+)/NADH kinase [Simkaniaceae bacterium]|nr:NAD(+)/NADH kinase [Simkaniaceae bacterium]
MIIALFVNLEKPQDKKIAKEVIAFFKRHKIQVVSSTLSAQELHIDPISSVDETKIKFLISMGGDGSILDVAHTYQYLDAAILGINLGHLGFMADVPIADLYPSLEDLLSGKYNIDERIIIEGMAPDGKTSFAINDFVIHRASNPTLVEISIHVDDLYLNTFEADGVILATPNGSTAYSLAAGGPILSPSCEAMVITPISPHTISNRPIVLTSEQKIQVQYLSDYKPIEVIADGLVGFTLKPGETFSFKRSPKTFKLVNLLRRDYFSTLRTKLGWAGKLR